VKGTVPVRQEEQSGTRNVSLRKRGTNLEKDLISGREAGSTASGSGKAGKIKAAGNLSSLFECCGGTTGVWIAVAGRISC